MGRCHAGKGFILDGIIDEARWRSARRKVLLLLKEAYDEPGVTEGFDLRAVIRDRWKGAKYNIWWNAAYWCYAAQAQSGVPPLPASEAEYVAANEALLGAAVVNVKKSDGRSESSETDIARYATLDGSLLKEQIRLIHPEIVICGSTFGAVRDLWPAAAQAYDLLWKCDGMLIVDFWHPANQFPKKLNYYCLGCILEGGGVYDD
jgi:hypothetical protein